MSFLQFHVQQEKLPQLHLQGWTSDPNSPDLNPLDYQGWGNAGVLSQAATKAKNSCRLFVDAHQLIWSALLENVIDNAVKDFCKRRQAYVSANGRHFEHVM